MFIKSLNYFKNISKFKTKMGSLCYNINMVMVKDLILYQVATDKNFRVGDKFAVGEIPNGQWHRVFDKNFRKDDFALFTLGFKYADSKNIFKKKDLVIDLSKAMTEYDFILRELAAEQVRKEKYAYLPSRFSCMFLSEDKDVALKNLVEIQKRGMGRLFQAVAVKVSGNVFYAREIGLERKALSYSDYLQIAEKYWGQNQFSNDPVKEILFEGNAEIIEILDEIFV